MTLYTRFGPDRVQELGNIVFYRDEPRYPGARILLTGNDNIYGDNYYYETNWLDKTLSIVSTLFSPRTEYYRSPYYYDNYPSDYVAYNVVDRPYYRTRIERLYPQPVFVYTTAPTFKEKIKIKSPNNGLHLGQIYRRPKKPTKEQAEFIKNHPGKPGRVKDDKGRDRGDKGKQDRGQGDDKGDPGKRDKKADGPSMKGDKGKDGDKGKGKKP